MVTRIRNILNKFEEGYEFWVDTPNANKLAMKRVPLSGNERRFAELTRELQKLRNQEMTDLATYGSVSGETLHRMNSIKAEIEKITEPFIDTRKVKKELEAAIKKHDFFYSYSDDNRYYKKGKESIANIRRLRKESRISDNEYKKLWNKYAPDGAKIK